MPECSTCGYQARAFTSRSATCMVSHARELTKVNFAIVRSAMLPARSQATASLLHHERRTHNMHQTQIYFDAHLHALLHAEQRATVQTISTYLSLVLRVDSRDRAPTPARGATANGRQGNGKAKNPGQRGIDHAIWRAQRCSVTHTHTHTATTSTPTCRGGLHPSDDNWLNILFGVSAFRPNPAFRHPPPASSAPVGPFEFVNNIHTCSLRHSSIGSPAPDGLRTTACVCTPFRVGKGSITSEPGSSPRRRRRDPTRAVAFRVCVCLCPIRWKERTIP